jgi:hypothetical protein
MTPHVSEPEPDPFDPDLLGLLNLLHRLGYDSFQERQRIWFHIKNYRNVECLPLDAEWHRDKIAEFLHLGVPGA